MGEQFRSRSAGKSVPSDQDLNCSLFDLLGFFWSKCDQWRSWSDSTNVLADLDLHWLHMRKKAYIWRKGLRLSNLLFGTSNNIYKYKNMTVIQHYNYVYSYLAMTLMQICWTSLISNNNQRALQLWHNKFRLNIDLLCLSEDLQNSVFSTDEMCWVLFCFDV
jgi:hypothetical protein